MGLNSPAVKRLAMFGAVVLVGLLCPTTAHAIDVPPEHKGFQLALRTGIALPFGSVSSATKMSDAFGVQVPFLIDIGYKFIPQLFIGVYLGVAIGGASGATDAQCAQVGINCTGLGFRGGVMAQYNFSPEKLVNPWIGFGFGYELGGTMGSTDENSISASYRGFELAHLMGGVDFRIQDYFGVGPFLDIAIGQYDNAKIEQNAGGHVTTLGGSITDKSPHAWGIIGVRAVAFP
jgi:hypothetical protein